MRKVDAQYIMNTLTWLDLEKPSNKFKFKPKLNKDGLYECSFELPFRHIKCNGVGKNKLDAINNVAKLAWHIILAEIDGDNLWPLYPSGTFCKANDYIAVEDESGEFKVLTPSEIPDAFA